MTNFPLNSEQTEASEITAICDYLKQIPLDFWGPKYPLLDLFHLWDLTSLFECAPHDRHLAELASLVVLRFLAAKLEFEKNFEFAKFKRAMILLHSLGLVALAGMIALRWYEPNTTGFGYSMVQIGIGSLNTFMILFSVFFVYYINAFMRAYNRYHKCVYLLSSAQTLARHR